MHKLSRSSSPAWFIVVGGVVLAVAVGALIISSSVAPGRPGRPPAASAEATQQIHGSGGDALDWSSTPGVSLDEGLARMSGIVALPHEEVAGHIVKTVIDETAADAQGNPGLLVLYDSGVKLMIAPGAVDLGETETEESAPFEDGTTKPFRRAKVAGRDSVVAKGGIQVLPHRKYRMEPRVMWNMNGYTYSLVAGAESVTLADLMKVAQSVR